MLAFKRLRVKPMDLLQISELPHEQTEAAFALVRLATDWTLPEWRRAVGSDRSEGGGALCATASGGVMLGVATYQVESDRRLGRVLRITTFVAFELGGAGATRKALRERLDRLAEQLGCRAVLFGSGSRGLVGAALS